MKIHLKTKIGEVSIEPKALDDKHESLTFTDMFGGELEINEATTGFVFAIGEDNAVIIPMEAIDSVVNWLLVNKRVYK
jgi:hypothetical protein